MSVITPTILSEEGRPMPPTYELLSLDITREVNRIASAQVTLGDGDMAHNTLPISAEPFFKPGKVIEIKLRYEGAPGDETTVFKGLVMKQGMECDVHGAVLTIGLKDAAIKLTRVRHSQVYRDQTDADIIKQIVSAHGLASGSVADTSPQHAELVQYDCTDWDFLLMRAESQGLLVVVDDGTISAHKIAVSGTPQHRFTYGKSEIYALEVEVDASYPYADVQSVAWDIAAQQLTAPSQAQAFDRTQEGLEGDAIVPPSGGETYTLTAPVPLDQKELQAWAAAHLARSRLAMLRGRLSVPGTATMKLLDVMELVNVGKCFSGTTLITGIRHRVTTQGWLTDVQFGLAPERFAERDGITDVPASGLLPAVHGLQMGIVDDFVEDPEKQLRVKVNLAGLDTKAGAVWARLASPDAGKARGYVFRPEPGDEVVVGFLNDDPRQAIILGACFSTKNTLPERASPLREDNLTKVIVTKKGTIIGFVDAEKASVFIETPNKNTVVLDDDAEIVRITDQHRNTITLGKDGIVIESAKDLTLKARGNVAINGQKVDVQ